MSESRADGQLLVGSAGTDDSFTGTTAVSGPPDLVADIYQAVGYNETDETVPCDVNFQMSLEFGGKQFPINPLDWVQVTSDTLRTGRCNFLLQVNSTGSEWPRYSCSRAHFQSGDVPSAGDYTSWIFGKLSRFLDATFVLTQSSPSGDVFSKTLRHPACEHPLTIPFALQ